MLLKIFIYVHKVCICTVILIKLNIVTLIMSIKKSGGNTIFLFCVAFLFIICNSTKTGCKKNCLQNNKNKIS